MLRFLHFWRDQRGNTALLFGLLAVPLVALGGGAVDFTQRGRVKGELQSATDTAALAAARFIQLEELKPNPDRAEIDEKAKTLAKDFIAASLLPLNMPREPDAVITISQSRVTVTAGYDLDTSFLGIIGINELPVRTLSAAELPGSFDVEIAMALDYSGSMLDNDKYIRMRDAATTFISRIKRERASRALIGIVPFSENVFAALPGAMIRDTPPEDAMVSMPACLSNRDYPYSASGDTPTLGIAPSRWPQNTATCADYTANGLATRDLTDDFDGLMASISAMQPLGATNIALASEMAWHMLSPTAPFTTAGNFGQPGLKKVMILLTDGVQTVPAEGPDGTISNEAANAVTSEVCSKAKAEGVRIFSIAYDIDDPAAYGLLSGCASGPAEYKEVHDAEDIQQVFEDIYAQIAQTSWLSE